MKYLWVSLGILALSACTLSRPALTPSNLSGESAERVLDRLSLTQTATLREDVFEVCFSLKNLSKQGIILRAPLSYHPGGQLQIAWGKAPSLPPPRGKRPLSSDFLSFDILAPQSEITVCASEARGNLPDHPIEFVTVFQPWSHLGTALPARLALRSDLRLPDLPEGVATTAPCSLSAASNRVECSAD